MEMMKKHKLPILMPLLMAVLAVAVGLASTLMGTSLSADKCISVGQQYLNELNYSGAVLEFSRAIELDPNNRDARVGLAQAYSASGNYVFAQEVLTDVLDEDRLDTQLAEQLVQVRQDAGDIGGAIQIVDQLIQQTDDPAYYEKRTELMKLLFSRPHSYAKGTDQSLLVRNGVVVSSGRNGLGQLGTANSLGDRDAEQTSFASAQFPGTPASVYCAGRTSYVLDQAGDLWAAGENRWGQMGLAYGTALPEAGWVQLTDSGDVVSAAGSAGVLLVLKEDGSLWQAGAGATQDLRQISDFPAVQQVAAHNRQYYVLTTGGVLYTGTLQNNIFQWSRTARGVSDFTVSGHNPIWLTGAGSLGNWNGNLPQDWTTDGDYRAVPVGLTITDLASNDKITLLYDGQAGALYQMSRDGSLKKVAVSGKVLSVYSEAGSAIVELDDGTVLCWAPGEDRQASM